MTADDFFALLWCINALLFALFGLIGLTAAGFALRYFLTVRGHAAESVRADPLEANLTRFTFSDFMRLDGTRYLLCFYGPPHDLKGSLLSYDSGEYGVRNYLLYDVDTHEATFLLPTHAQTVRLTERLWDGLHTHTGPLPPIRWLCLHIVDADTNGDGRLTEEDGFAIAYANRDGTGLQSVLRGVASVLEHERLGDDGSVIFYQKDNRFWVSEINIAERRVAHTAELPTITQIV